MHSVHHAALFTSRFLVAFNSFKNSLLQSLGRRYAMQYKDTNMDNDSRVRRAGVSESGGADRGSPALVSPCRPLLRDGMPVAQSEAYGSFVRTFSRWFAIALTNGTPITDTHGLWAFSSLALDSRVCTTPLAKVILRPVSSRQPFESLSRNDRRFRLVYTRSVQVDPR